MTLPGSVALVDRSRERAANRPYDQIVKASSSNSAWKQSMVTDTPDRFRVRRADLNDLAERTTVGIDRTVQSGNAIVLWRPTGGIRSNGGRFTVLWPRGRAVGWLGPGSCMGAVGGWSVSEVPVWLTDLRDRSCRIVVPPSKG